MFVLRLGEQQSLSPATAQTTDGQVAQLVERGPEKAGVGGSIPSLATILSLTHIPSNH
jgi:hypothetical protein